MNLYIIFYHLKLLIKYINKLKKNASTKNVHIKRKDINSN